MFCRTSILAALMAIYQLGLAAPVRLSAQAIAVGGGDSSLYQAAGGTVSLFASKYDLSFSAGSAGGSFVEGARLLRPTKDGTFVIGDDRVDFELPTDIFDDSHFLLVRGLGYRLDQRDSHLVAFLGTSAKTYNTPLFAAASFGDPVGILFLSKTLNKNWQFLSDTVASYNWTQIGALRWSLSPRTEAGFSAGIGDRKPFAAVSLKAQRTHYDLKASYVLAGQQFRRTALTDPLFSEPDKENLLFNLRPWRSLSLGAGIQNFLVPLATGTANAQSSVDHGSAGFSLLGAQFSGVLLRSTYQQAGLPNQSNHSVAFSLARDLTQRIGLQANYYVSKPRKETATDSFVANITEQLNSHLTAIENITYSNGHTGINFGGEIFSNLVTLTATYDTVYVPAQNYQPFEQALLLDLKFRFFAHLVLHGSSFVDPTGHLRYTAEANSVLNRNSSNRKASAVATLGRYVMRGCVLDARGRPVEGAAVLIDQKHVFSDSSGCFSAWENHPHIHTLSLALNEFLNGGHWQVLSMPHTIANTREESSLEAAVVVTVRLLPETAATPADPPPSTPTPRLP